MASGPTVFEVLIHRAEGDREGAALLQRRLRRDGIRAGVTELSVPVADGTTPAARHSVCFIGTGSGHADSLATAAGGCEVVFVAPGDTSSGRTFERTYAQLVDRIGRGGVVPISAAGLRHATMESYDAIAEQFTDVWYDAIPGEAIETFVQHLRRGATVLDAGCGPGHHARFLRQVGFEPVGLDFSQAMLDIAASKGARIPLVRGDALSYPLPRAHFDGVWSAVMLNHVPAESLPFALENLVASLKGGGVIGLNLQVGRPSERVSWGNDRRFFEYPTDERAIVASVEALGIQVVDSQVGRTRRNTHGLPLDMRFATIVGKKAQ